MRDTAIVVYGNYIQHGILPNRNPGFDQQRDELSILSGQTQVANSKRLNDSGSRRSAASPERSVSPRESLTGLSIGGNGLNNVIPLQAGTNSSGSQSSPTSPTSYQDLFAASGYRYDYEKGSIQQSSHVHSQIQGSSTDYPWSPLNALDGLYVPGNAWAAQTLVSQQLPNIVSQGSLAPETNSPMDMGMFEAAGTADQAWDHSWMAFLRDSGLG